MFSHFFIRRPIFASVLSIVIFIAGAVAVFNLPIAQYPPITPPTINVSCTYPGAAAQDVADSVAAPIEQQINGVEGMMYMVSQSNNDGSYNLTVTFKPGVNLNFAQVLVQNRINLALPLLPDVVKQAGVNTRKRNPDILLVIAVYSPHGRYDQLHLSNFATIRIKDEIARVDGVGDCQQFGQEDYSMRVWLDPGRLAALNLNAGDVTAALREQNRQVAAGHFGSAEAVSRSSPSDRSPPAHEFTITTTGRLTDPADYEDIVIRTDVDGRRVRIKDIGSVKLGARNLDSTSQVDGLPNASLAVWALPDANSIATAQRVRDRLEELKKSFPEDIDYVVALDMTPFIQESIDEVVRTLIEAIILVAIVVMIFLQSWRSALIPLIAVPVAIIGTFAAMAVIGFSLNTLTLFGLVLAVGIVVDDAIVVVEAVEPPNRGRPVAAAGRSQGDGPGVGARGRGGALVLSAVFVPCAFITGINGMFFRQFAATIAVSTVISAFNSLTLSPACAARFCCNRAGPRKTRSAACSISSSAGSFACSIGLFNAARAFTLALSAALSCALEGDRPGRLRRPLDADLVDVGTSAERLYSQPRSGALLYRRAVARRRFVGAHAKSRRSHHGHPRPTRRRRQGRHRAHHRYCRPIVHPQRQRLQLRTVLRHARRIRQTPRSADAQFRDLRSRARRLGREDSGSQRGSVHAAARIRPGHRQRFQDHHRGSRRLGPWRTAKTGGSAHRCGQRRALHANR